MRVLAAVAGLRAIAELGTTGDHPRGYVGPRRLGVIEAPPRPTPVAPPVATTAPPQDFGLDIRLPARPGESAIRPLRVLALGPHVDDVEIGCGATLLRLVRYHDAEIHVRVFSDHYAVPERQERTLEGMRAAERMGYESFQIFQYEDTNFPADARQIQKRIAGLRESLAPDLILSPSDRDTHQDHRALALAVQREFRYGESIWCYEINQFGANPSFEPNLYINVSLPSRSDDDQFLEEAARGAQIGPLMLENTLAHEKIWILDATMISQHGKPLLRPDISSAIMLMRGMQSSRDVRFAEAFHARTVVHH